jgi:DNA-binding transcriptional ArsR family regulator
MTEMNLRSVSLTPRDLLLLQGLYDFTVLSFSQVRQKFFKDKSISTASNRLSKLEEGGIIKSFRVPKFYGSMDKPGVSVLFQITRNGIRELQKRNFTEVLRDQPIKLHGYSIEHDVLLNDVIDALELKFPGSKLIHGKLLTGKEMASGLNSDALLTKPDGITKYAIELELSLKAESRYREIVLKYRLAQSIAKVIYVIGHPAIKEKLVNVLGGTPQTVGGKPLTGKFFFVGLDDLLNRTSIAKINNGNDILNREECV